MRPQLSATSIMRYLHVSATSPAAVGTEAHTLRSNYGAEYSPARDWWRGMRTALASDRRTTRDGQALRAAATNVRDPKKKPLYSAMADAWPDVAERWVNHVHVPVRPVTITLGGLDVRVSPSFCERSAEGTEVVIVSFTERKIDDTAIDGVLRLLQRAYPGVEGLFIDLRRPGRIRTTRGRDLEHLDGWLESAAVYLAHVLSDAA